MGMARQMPGPRAAQNLPGGGGAGRTWNWLMHDINSRSFKQKEEYEYYLTLSAKYSKHFTGDCGYIVAVRSRADVGMLYTLRFSQ